jgi:TolA-binding protein
MKYRITLITLAATALFTTSLHAQFQYRSDDNDNIIRSILEDRVPVKKSAQETIQSQPARKEEPGDIAPDLKKAITETQKQTVTKQNGKTKTQSSTARQTSKGKTKKSGGNIPSALGADKVLLETGISLYEAGNDSAAIDKFRQIGEKYPTSQCLDQASIWLSRALVRSGRGKEGLAELEKIREDSGEYPASLYISGTIYRDLMIFDRATEQFYKLSSRFPGDDLADDALIAAGKIHLSQKNGGLALTAATHVVKLYSDRDTLDDAYFLIGMILEKDPDLRDIEKARLVFKKFVYRAEVEKLEVFTLSPLLDRVKREITYIDRMFYKKN